MIQERTTSLRILQNNKKKTLSPVRYLLIGFVLGLLFAALIFFVFVANSSTPNAKVLQSVDEHESIQTYSKEVLSNNDAHIDTDQTLQPSPETLESDEDNNFTQPGSNDLNKFFQRIPVAAPTPTGQQISPFANEPNAKPVSTAASENMSQRHNKTTPKASHQPEKVALPATKTTRARRSEPDPETPAASLQITVTQNL